MPNFDFRVERSRIPNPLKKKRWLSAIDRSDTFYRLLHGLLRVTAGCLIVSGCASLPTNFNRIPSNAWSLPEQTLLGQMTLKTAHAAAASGRVKTSSLADSGFYLLDSDAVAFATRLTLVEAAQKTIDIQYYAIHADETTDQLFDALKLAASRGVRVRILLDDFNTSGKNIQVLSLAYVPGIELRLFNPLPGSRNAKIGRVLGALYNAQALQRRMHNKMMAADSAMAITGGRNLGETYFGQGTETNFIDFDVLSAGRIVRELSASFDQFWNHALAYPAQALLVREEFETLQQARTPDAAVGANRWKPLATADTRLARLGGLPWVWADSRMLADLPSKIESDNEAVAQAQNTLIDQLLALLAQTRHDILIVSPYLVPGPRMMAQLAAIRQKGVRVRILTNSLASTDAPAAHVGYARYRAAMLALGIELYEMRAEQAGASRVFGSSAESLSRLHSKLVIMDSQVLVIGSMNLDLRSQLQNTELALVIHSPTLAQDAARRIEPTLRQGAYRLSLKGNTLTWHAPLGTQIKDTDIEPDASFGLKLLLMLLAPFVSDDML